MSFILHIIFKKINFTYPFFGLVQAKKGGFVPITLIAIYIPVTTKVLSNDLMSNCGWFGLLPSDTADSSLQNPGRK